MTHDDLETVKRIYEAWERGDFRTGVELFHPELTMVVDGEIPDAGTYEGLEGLRRYTRGFLEAWGSVTIAAESLEDGGGTLLARVRQEAEGRDSGAAVTMNYFQVWTLRDGRVIRLESILREEQARAAIAD